MKMVSSCDKFDCFHGCVYPGNIRDSSNVAASALVTHDCSNIYPLKCIGYRMTTFFNTYLCILLTECISVFCIVLKINKRSFPKQR